MPNKPDWKDAPEWANWYAEDHSGEKYFYECEPTPDSEIKCFRISSGRFAKIVNDEWINSLEQRPKVQAQYGK